MPPSVVISSFEECISIGRGVESPTQTGAQLNRVVCAGGLRRSCLAIRASILAIVYLAPWAAYTIESKGSTFKYVRLPGNSPAEWEVERPQWGARGKLVYLPGRQNPLHIAWKKSQILLSNYVR